MLRVWAVAKTTIRQAVRMKVAIVFILLLLILLPLLGLTATGDGTLKGRLQTCVSYGFSLTSLLLCLLTIIVSIYTITSDIEQHQIYTVVTKPIRRYQIVLGKLLGVLTLDVALLALFLAIIFTVTMFMPRLVGASADEIALAQNEFYTARTNLKPPVEDVSKEVDELYAKLQREDQLETAFPGLSRPAILQQLTTRKRLEKQAVGPGELIGWEFNGVHPADPNQYLFIRFKYDVSSVPADEQIQGRWYVGDMRRTPSGEPAKTHVYVMEPKDTVRKFHEIAVPADAVAADGFLGVAFGNFPANDTVVIFPLEDGLELLYKVGNFEGNFIRGGLLILFRLIFLACLGTLAASFLSFPVAILFCLVVFLTGMVSGFVLESFDMLSVGVGQIYTYTVRVIVELLPQFDRENPTSFLVTGRQMSWMLLGQVVLVMVGIKAMLLLVAGLVIFSLRELARVIV
jgi:hypothetical protein